jgi:hypothetical protein
MIPGSKEKTSEHSGNPTEEPVNLRDPESLRKLYCTELKSLKQIAGLAGTTKSDVHYWMVKHGIARREWSACAPKCNPKVLHELYWNQGKTIRAIAQLKGVSFTTARKHLLRETALGRLRTRWTIRYQRTQFSENRLERAYLQGFRGGDLNAARTSPNSIMARVSTTHPAMLELFTQAFERYGHCSVVPRKVFLTGYDWQVRTYLDTSFSYLVTKPQHVPIAVAEFYAFLAGLSDSDGCWTITHDGTRLKYAFLITTEECDLVQSVKSKLQDLAYHPTLHLDRRKGTTKIMHGIFGPREITLSKDMWELRLQRLGEVSLLASHVLSHSRHREKIEKMQIILSTKTKNWSSIESIVKNLRNRTKEEVSESIRKAEIEYKARHPGSVPDAGSSARPMLNPIQLGASLV